MNRWIDTEIEGLIADGFSQTMARFLVWYGLGLVCIGGPVIVCLCVAVGLAWA